MATPYSGTVLKKARAGELGKTSKGIGYYALTGALVINDTITFTNILPKNVKPLSVKFWSPELDTNATPTGTLSIGNSDSATGYLTAVGMALGLSNSLAQQLVYNGNGTLITAGAAITNRDVVITVATAVATGAATGTLFVEIEVEAV